MDHQLTALGREVSSALDREIARDAARHAPATVDAHLAAARAGRRAVERGRDRGRWAAIAAVAALACALLVWRPRPAALTFSVGTRGTPGSVGAWVGADAPVALPVTFSDGSTLRLEPASGARVTAVSARGARVALERGQAHVHVLPRPGNDWSIVAGPFEVHVTGTEFDAAWDTTAQRLRVRMDEGSVEIRGACLTESRRVVAGETIELGCADDAPRAPDAAAAVLTDEPAARAREQDEPPPQAASDALASAAPQRAPRASRAHDDDDAGALLEDLPALVARVSLRELAALAEEARLRGDTARAHVAYLAIRDRAPRTALAAVAAFHLGRIAFDAHRSPALAQRWFATYLDEQPDGALAREALGRALECDVATGDEAGARLRARRYLTAFPDGPHAPLARRALDAP